jgi:hypothetical protein
VALEEEVVVEVEGGGEEGKFGMQFQVIRRMTGRIMCYQVWAPVRKLSLDSREEAARIKYFSTKDLVALEAAASQLTPLEEERRVELARRERDDDARARRDRAYHVRQRQQKAWYVYCLLELNKGVVGC